MKTPKKFNAPDPQGLRPFGQVISASVRKEVTDMDKTEIKSIREISVHEFNQAVSQGWVLLDVYSYTHATERGDRYSGAIAVVGHVEKDASLEIETQEGI